MKEEGPVRASCAHFLCHSNLLQSSEPALAEARPALKVANNSASAVQMSTSCSFLLVHDPKSQVALCSLLLFSPCNPTQATKEPKRVGMAGSCQFFSVEEQEDLVHYQRQVF